MWNAMRLFVMTGLWSVSLLCGIALCDDAKGLQVGDKVPDFQILDDQGRMWKSSEYVGKHILVIYFYPSDFSFCCTSKAKRYRDIQPDLVDQGVKLIGISADTVQAHRMFKAACSINFPLLADENGSVAGQFGVPFRAGGKSMVKDAEGKEIVDDTGKTVAIQRRVTTARWTIIIGKDGRILYRETAASPVNDSQEVLKFLSKLAAK